MSPNRSSFFSLFWCATTKTIESETSGTTCFWCSLTQTRILPCNSACTHNTLVRFRWPKRLLELFGAFWCTDLWCCFSIWILWVHIFKSQMITSSVKIHPSATYAVNLVCSYWIGYTFPNFWCKYFYHPFLQSTIWNLEVHEFGLF
jgi:hypothetical protein